MTVSTPARSLSLPRNGILHGDCLRLLSTIPNSSIDLICTDPPYGIGYMAKTWDTFHASGNKRSNPTFQSWFGNVAAECLRVLKPGAFMFVLMTPRQDSLARAIVALEDAGFNIGFTSLYWTYASGFPKAANIGKAVDKKLGRAREVLGTQRQPDLRGDNYGQGRRVYKDTITHRTRGTHPLEGSYGGFQPKPAVEVVIVAMKPLTERTFADQALANGKGVTWLDDCRIPAARHGSAARADGATAPLRFPANLLVSDDVLNDGHVRKGSITSKVGTTYGTDHGSGYLQSKAHGTNINDAGSYSRYFSLDAWAKTMPFLIVPKARRAERDNGLRTGANRHPTVKPLALMSYLVTLGSRPGDLVLDPFLGSGTTALAAKLLGRRYLGIEREAAYVTIARKRVAFGADGAEATRRHVQVRATIRKVERKRV